jgi:hypothetical protein
VRPRLTVTAGAVRHLRPRRTLTAGAVRSPSPLPHERH